MNTVSGCHCLSTECHVTYVAEVVSFTHDNPPLFVLTYMAQTTGMAWQNIKYYFNTLCCVQIFVMMEVFLND